MAIQPMEPEVPMILPKGIVVNTREIYEEVARYQNVPSDRVWEIWRVYTTTNKRLQDPTARRLENFWWHVLGSDRRLLSGETLATLYEDISLGPTFVPLRGPPNRWEGDDVPPFIQRAIAILEAEKGRAQPQSETALNDTRAAGLKDLSSSAAKPPPSHPILKKPRGPSSSGPRPTARFVSPHVSGDETEKDSDVPSSGSTVTRGLEMKSSFTSPAKKKTTTGKKFVASTGAAKRRPVLPRKNSSQSSTTSEHAQKEGSSSASSRSSGTPQRPISPITEGVVAPPSPKPGASPKLSAKAAGKRPMPARRTTEEQRLSGNQDVGSAGSKKSGSAPRSPLISAMSSETTEATKQDAKTFKKRPQSLVNLPGYAPPTNQASSTISHTSPAPEAVGSVPMAQSRSHSGYVYRREPGTPGTPKRSESGLFTGPTASTTNIAAQGVIIDQSGGISPRPGVTSFFDSLPPRESAVGSLSSSLLEPRLTPTQPTTTGSVPLGRTKSQLTLLLEREDQARAGNKPRSRS